MRKTGGKRKPKPPATAAKAKSTGGAAPSSQQTVAGGSRKRKEPAEEPEVPEDPEPEDLEAEEEPARREFATGWGAPFMIFRVLLGIVTTVASVDTVRWLWQRCTGTTEGHVSDSFVYRYEREVGFLRRDAAEEAADARIAAARERLRQDNAGKIKSHDQRVNRFSYFERYCLDKHPDHEWCVWLRSLGNGGDHTPDEATLAELRRDRLEFMAPTEGLVTAYAQALRNNPDGDSYIEMHKGGTIRVYVGAIGACCKEFHAEPPTHEIAPVIAEWEDTDGNESSEGFDFVKDLPLMWSACWSMAGWGYARMLETWVMLLISICLMGRASDVTTFCPLIEDTRLPPEQLWGKDGYPLWIELGMRDWKWRSKKNKGKRYGVRLHRNTLDSRFCPVVWLLFWLSHTELTEGPIFQKGDGEALPESHWTRRTTRLFTAVNLYKPAVYEVVTKKDGDGQPYRVRVKVQDATGCTNHAIRRSAIQWCGRCLGNPLDGKNNGRWKTYEEMAGYHAQGAVDRSLLTEGGGKDPIWGMWVWKPTTPPGMDGRNQM